MEDIIFRYVKPIDRKPAKGIFSFLKKKPTSGLDPDFDYAYGYALLVACDTIGESIQTWTDGFHTGSTWKNANTLLGKANSDVLLDKLWTPELLFDIPEIGDFPVISHFSKKEIQYLLNIFQNVKIDEQKADFGYEEFDEDEGFFKNFRDGLELCYMKDVEWISFIH